jgi:hypothetical protein
MVDLPDFHIPHAEKIEWMIETAGWAVEPVQPDAEAVPPTPAYCYTDSGCRERPVQHGCRTSSGRHGDSARR